MRFQWTPLWFRVGLTAFLQHLGGIHSGAGTSSLQRLLYVISRSFQNPQSTHVAVLAMSMLVVIFITIGHSIRPPHRPKEAPQRVRARSSILRLGVSRRHMGVCRARLYADPRKGRVGRGECRVEMGRNRSRSFAAVLVHALHHHLDIPTMAHRSESPGRNHHSP